MISSYRLGQKITLILPYLNEKQQRLYLATEARYFGRGGISKIATLSGSSRPTIYKGLRELKGKKSVKEETIRKSGAGRKSLGETSPEIANKLETLVEPYTIGDPMSPLRWTIKSTRQLSDELMKMGYPISHTKVGQLLKDLDYSLQSNVKSLEGSTHPDRDQQFCYLNDLVKEFLSQNNPVISVDTKKKELIGNYKNGGREWRPKGSPEKVNVHDFPDSKMGKAIPYGVYDLGSDTGWVNVGHDHDTAQFAVESIKRWWLRMGKEKYSRADSLLICADSGGSNGYRRKLWKTELQKFANESGLKISVCHFPPGTSKWNKIEHRLFSFISMNWRGKPLTSYEVVVQLIGSTRTKTGLNVQATLDHGVYPIKIKITKKQLEAVTLVKHNFHGEWNYSILPQM